MPGSWSRSLVATLLVCAAPAAASAQVSPGDRAQIARMAQARGVADADVAPLLDEVSLASERGLPQQALVNKIKEGFAKGYPASRTLGVLRDMVGHLDAARAMLGPGGDDAARSRAIVMLGEAFFGGVTREEFQELRTLAEVEGRPAQAEGLAVGARFWSQLKVAGFAANALPLVAETVRQNYRAADVAALAREMAVRRQDLASTARLDALRQAVSRGERPERVLPPREVQTTPERTRPEPTRPAPERPQRERPERAK